MQINRKCRWQRFQAVGKSQPKKYERSWLHKVGTIYSNDQVQLNVNFWKNIQTLPKRYMHIFNLSIWTVQSLKNVSQEVWEKLITQSRTCATTQKQRMKFAPRVIIPQYITFWLTGALGEGTGALFCWTVSGEDPESCVMVLEGGPRSCVAGVRWCSIFCFLCSSDTG
jgi:hypothetical protein